ncbi:MAG: DUF87 domain-containing protein [Pseudomonadota bacterium]
MSAFARIASEIFPDEAPEPAAPIGTVIAILRDSITAAIPRQQAEAQALLPGTPVALGQGAEVYGTIAALDALVPVTAPHPDDIVIVEIDPSPMSDVTALPIGAPLRPLTPTERHAIHTEGVVAPLPIGEADWGAGPVPFVLDAQALLGANLILTGEVGSGKSCSLAVIFRSLLRTRFSGRLLLIDPSSGFAQSFGGGADIVDVEAALIPFGMMAPEQVAAAIGVVAEPLSLGEFAVLRGLMRRSESAAQTFRPASSVSPSLSAVIDACHHRAESSDFGEAARSLGAKLSVAAHDPRLRPFFSEAASALSAADVLQNVFRLPDGRPPMSVLQLGALDDEVRPIMAAVVVDLAQQLSAMAGQQIPLMVGLDSAEELLASDTGPLTDVLSRPTLPGLGVCLDVVSQDVLPAKLSAQTSVVIDHALGQGAEEVAAVDIAQRDKPFVEQVMISRLKPGACPHPAHPAASSMPPSREDLLASIVDAWQSGSAR